MSTMKAAIVKGFGDELEVEDAAIPQPGPGQVLVKLIASGVCHTDLHAAEGDWPVKPKLPLIPGHEGVGTVEKLGEGVTEVGLYVMMVLGADEFSKEPETSTTVPVGAGPDE